MRYHITLILFFALIINCFAQKRLKINITNQEGIPLAGVLVSEDSSKIIDASDNKGNVNFVFREYKNICFILYGYYDTCIYISDISTNLLIKMREKPIITKEVYISSEKKDQNLYSIQTGTFEIRPDSFRNLPNIAGEADPFRMLQLTPGVSKTDVNLGLNIRGGSTDQNLVLIDDAVIYNPSHLAGFLSIFNPLSINQVTLLKSGIPVYYGGRLSSVTVVETEKNIPDKLHFKSNTGLLLSGISFKTPLLKNKTAVFFSMRRSYIDQTVKPFSNVFFKRKQSMFTNSKYSFYDINAGITISPAYRDMVYINAYVGNDDFALYNPSYYIENKLSWSNSAISAKWVHNFGNTYNLKTVFYYSSNSMNLFMGQSESEFKFYIDSKIDEFSLQHEHAIYFSKNNIKMGFQAQNQSVTPNQSQAQLSSLYADFGTPNIFNILTISPYFHSEINFSKKSALIAGIRGNFYYHYGPYNSFIRDISKVIIDTIDYKRNDIVAHYINYEPRISYRYIIDSVSSLKLSVSQNIQFLQQVNVTAVSFPTDFWIPASEQIKPQTGIQWSGGYFYNFNDNQYESSIELFYKKMNHLLEFKNGLLTATSKATMEENIIEGTGNAYGIEFLLQKKTGNFTGWLSYTLSRSERKFADIDSGKPFPAKYDRTHDLSILLQYQLNNRWKTSLVFIFATGNAYTMPYGRYMVGGNIVNQYGSYNTFRMPAYHRLDISFTRVVKKTALSEQNLNLNFYNVYSRLNPYYIYFNVKGDLKKYYIEVSPRLVALFPFLPSFSYEYRF